MANDDDGLPGVVLKLETSEVAGISADSRRILKLGFRAWVKDKSIWDQVEKKLEAGLKIYTTDDFKTEMMRTLRDENHRLEDEKHALLCEKSRLMTENADLKSSLSAIISRDAQPK